jgi:hypothetical protein
MPYRTPVEPAPKRDDSQELRAFEKHLRGDFWSNLLVTAAGVAIAAATTCVVLYAPFLKPSRPTCDHVQRTLPTGEAYVEQRCGDEVTMHFLHDPRVNEVQGLGSP